MMLKEQIQQKMSVETGVSVSAHLWPRCLPMSKQPLSMDVLTILLSARNEQLWLYYALIATVGSVMGGFVTYRLARKGGKETLARRFPRLLEKTDWHSLLLHKVILLQAVIDEPLNGNHLQMTGRRNCWISH
jgi:hypothetical protein